MRLWWSASASPEQTLIVGQPHTAMTYDGLGDGAVRGVYLANGSVLSGFTVTNGFTGIPPRRPRSTSMGAASAASRPLRVTNCVIAGNLAALRGGGIFQGTVVDCHVLTNAVRASSASAGGGGLYGATVLRSLVENNRTAGTSTDGGGAYGCTLDGCTLRGGNARPRRRRVPTFALWSPARSSRTARCRRAAEPMHR